MRLRNNPAGGSIDCINIRTNISAVCASFTIRAGIPQMVVTAVSIVEIHQPDSLPVLGEELLTAL